MTKSFRNSLGYEVLNPEMFAKIAGSDIKSKELSSQEQNDIVSELKSFDISDPNLNPDNPNLHSSSFSVDPLFGDNIIQHFENVGAYQSKELETKLLKFAKVEIPEPPTHYNGIISGYNFFDVNLNQWIYVEYPTETTVIFDCETFVKSGNLAILATFFSERGYYIWVHEAFNNTSLEYKPQLLDLGPVVKICIGVNVNFDAARVKETYLLQKPSITYIDTRSMFNVCHGLTSDLMMLFDTYKWNESMNPYCKYGSKASMLDSYNFYFRESEPMEEGSKAVRDVFVNCETINEMCEVAGGKDILYEYAIKDTYYTFKIFKKVIHEFLYYAPNPTHLSAMAILGSPKPTLDNNWHEWVSHCEELFEESLETITSSLSQMALDLMTEFQENDAMDTDSDPWNKYLSWYVDTKLVKKTVKVYEVHQINSPNPITINVPHGHAVGEYLEQQLVGLTMLRTSSGKIKAKKVSEKVDYVARNVNSYGKPEWFVKGVKKPITTKTVLAHYLCRLRWKGFPVYKSEDMGFCYRDENSVERKIPHKTGGDANVGGLLSKDYIKYFENGTLTAENPLAKALMDASARNAYWSSVRSRVKDVLTYKVPNPLNNGIPTLVAAAQVCPHNTVSSRTGQNLLNTVPGVKKEKIGTELKSMFMAPEGYKVVGADISAQEAQIFAMFADSYAGVSGSTPIGNIIINGSKDNEDDIHYKLAKIAGISRSDAKRINYGVNYGAGEKTVVKTLAMCNPDMGHGELVALAQKILEVSKGYKRGDHYYNGMSSKGFNFINDEIKGPNVSTRFLETRFSAALTNDPHNRNYMSLQNTTIQGAGADFLRCMLVDCKYLSDKYDLGALFMISLHDEMFYLVPEHNALKFAACFEMAHIRTWCFFQVKLGLHDLPLQRAFADGVFVGNRWCKELGSNVTVSNPVNTLEGREYSHRELIPIMSELFV